METYYLEASRLKDEASGHKALAQLFSFPETYGNNLDALYDLLSSLEPARLVLGGRRGEIALGFQRVFRALERQGFVIEESLSAEDCLCLIPLVSPEAPSMIYLKNNVLRKEEQKNA